MADTNLNDLPKCMYQQTDDVVTTPMGVTLRKIHFTSCGGDGGIGGITDGAHLGIDGAPAVGHGAGHGLMVSWPFIVGPAPIRGGYEGVGGKPLDGIEPMTQEEHAALILAAADKVDKSYAMADAIAALRHQHRSDGRPAHFFPVLEDEDA